MFGLHSDFVVCARVAVLDYRILLWKIKVLRVVSSRMEEFLRKMNLKKIATYWKWLTTIVDIRRRVALLQDLLVPADVLVC